MTKTQASNFFARLRHRVRRLHAQRTAMHDQEAMLDRQQRKQHGDAPPPALLVRHRQDLTERIGAISNELREAGYALMQLAPRIDQVTTLQERLSLINANVADVREIEYVGIGADTGIARLIFMYHLEDSASHRRDDFFTGPLFTVIEAVFMDFLQSEEGQEHVEAAHAEAFRPDGALARAALAGESGFDLARLVIASTAVH